MSMKSFLGVVSDPSERWSLSSLSEPKRREAETVLVVRFGVSSWIVLVRAGKPRNQTGNPIWLRIQSLIAPTWPPHP